ncbi:MAG TPA: hypothetical protein VK772_01190 [Puia sp.]|jgi:hypothetical protein|nr:hypothetical protein [Puia sp.]
MNELIENANTKEGFLIFLEAFIKRFYNNNDEWENLELGRYLEAVEAFVASSTDKSLVNVDFTPSWSLFARILFTASIYE